MPKSSKSSFEKEIAYHEASHAIIGLSLGRKLPYGVSIIPQDDGTLGQSSGDLNSNSEPEYKDVITELYAGYAAQIKFNPNSVQAKDVSGDDDEKAARFLTWCSGDPIKLEKKLRQKAYKLVDDNWLAIQILAEELVIRKWIDGQEIDALMDVIRGEVSLSAYVNFIAYYTRGFMGAEISIQEANEIANRVGKALASGVRDHAS